MSTLPDFADRQVTVTLTGVQWLALIAKINDKNSLNATGRAHCKAAVGGIAAQITAENERAEESGPAPINERWKTIQTDDSIEVVDQAEKPVFSAVCFPDDMGTRVERAVNFAAHAPIFFDTLLRVRAGMDEAWRDLSEDPDSVYAAWIAKIDAVTRGVVTP